MPTPLSHLFASGDPLAPPDAGGATHLRRVRATAHVAFHATGAGALITVRPGCRYRRVLEDVKPLGDCTSEALAPLKN